MKDPMFKPCAAWAEKLAATHPDDLSPTEQAALEAHVAECPACAAVRAEYRLMDVRILEFPANESQPIPPPLRIQKIADNDVNLPSPVLDRIYRKSVFHKRLFGNIPIPHMPLASLVIIIVVAFLIVSLILGIYLH